MRAYHFGVRLVREYGTRHECSGVAGQLDDFLHGLDEQHGNEPFNRAMLLNVGAAEALKQYNYACFVFHDVDLLPEDDRNIYR